MNFQKIVAYMRLASKWKSICEAEKNTLQKCILCKHQLSSQQWGPLLESFIKEKFNIGPAVDSVSGDGCSPKGLNIEIKVSLGDKGGQLNFVQLRPDHTIDYYLFLGYNLFEGELGQTHWLLCPSKELYTLLPTYGGYAHGTISKLGDITMENIYGRGCEYALRPNPVLDDTRKGKKLWNIMCGKFSVTEDDITRRI